jgi:hypothetical protein
MVFVDHEELAENPWFHAMLISVEILMDVEMVHSLATLLVDSVGFHVDLNGHSMRMEVLVLSVE